MNIIDTFLSNFIESSTDRVVFMLCAGLFVGLVVQRRLTAQKYSLMVILCWFAFSLIALYSRSFYWLFIPIITDLLITPSLAVWQKSTKDILFELPVYCMLLFCIVLFGTALLFGEDTLIVIVNTFK